MPDATPSRSTVSAATRTAIDVFARTLPQADTVDRDALTIRPRVMAPRREHCDG